MRLPMRRIMPETDRRADLIDPGLLALFEKAATGRAKWPLYLHSKPGRGKTRAGLWFCDVAKSAVFYTVESLIERILANSPAENIAMWDGIGRAGLGVLDEIGTRSRITDLGYSAVQRFADERELHGQRRTVFISNLPPDAIGKLYDDRTASRLLSGTHFELKRNDQRFA